MLLRRVVVENVRSFLDRTELMLDGSISILIGPNGGGKTNLLDAIVVMLRRHLFASMYAAHSPTAARPNRYVFQHNDALNSMRLEKHSAGSALSQVLEVEIEVTKRDLESMTNIKRDAEKIIELAGKKYENLQHQLATSWNVDTIEAGRRFTYRLVDEKLERRNSDEFAEQFLQYLQLAEMDSLLREEYGMDTLSLPMIYLPVNRSANAISSSVELAGFNAFEQKRQSDATTSGTNFSLVQLAIGRLAQRYRLLLEKDDGGARQGFESESGLGELTKILRRLGYEWKLISTEPLRNAYDIELYKQGSSFLVSRASSGERELLTYLFTTFALNVRDALIIVDEPELHLHPKWQAILLGLFEELAETTGNQFLLATHSPKFVSPNSIQYISRVFADRQRSQVVRLDVEGLPDGRHLFNIVNSQNNERLFFADKVLLVEGLSDRIFFEAVLSFLGLPDSGLALEVVGVGGKGFFAPYRLLLEACQVPYAVIADLDFIEQIGSDQVRALFVVDEQEIKVDVIENVKSRDGASLVAAIDKAIASGSWKGAEETWEYIKSRRRRLAPELSEEQRRVLAQFIQDKTEEQVFLLKFGALEAYLPAGFSDKRIDKLIRFVSEEGFWHKIAKDSQDEMRTILQSVCRMS